MLVTKLKAMSAVLLAVMVLGGGSLLTYGALGAGQTGAKKEGQSQAAARQDKKAEPDEEVLPPSLPVDEARRRHDAWLAASQAIRRDPSLVVYYTFEPEQEGSRTLRNQAGGRKRPHDGTIGGCSWVGGRWPGKRALEFKQVSDRVRLHVPGKFESVTLVAWVRVDALPNVNNSLLLADGWQVGGLHWQIGEGGKLVLGVKA